MAFKRTVKLLNMAQNFNINDSLNATVPMRRNLIHELNASSQEYVKEWVCDSNPVNSQNNENNNIIELNGENYEIVIQEQNYRDDIISAILGMPKQVQSGINVKNIE
ncbi:hypothetical protein QTP88_007798 [Uroleucon formosanum]